MAHAVGVVVRRPAPGALLAQECHAVRDLIDPYRVEGRRGDGDGPIHLYLSSTAKPKRLVGLAGVYTPPSAGVECDHGEEP